HDDHPHRSAGRIAVVLGIGRQARRHRRVDPARAHAAAGRADEDPGSGEPWHRCARRLRSHLMPLPPIPVDRELVPDTRQPVPDNLIRMRQPLVGGVPFSWPLDSELALTLFVPTGTAVLWRDADPTATVCDSTIEAAPNIPGARSHTSACLLLRRNQET